MVNPHVKVIGVEPCGAACIKASLQENKVVSLPSVDTVAEGTAVKTPGDVTFEFIKKYVDYYIYIFFLLFRRYYDKKFCRICL